MTTEIEATTAPETAAPDAAPESTPAPAEAPQEGAPAAASPAPDGAPAPAAAAPYVVNPVFKVKNAEKKMDEWLLSAVKTPEQEKAVRELYEKAYGLEHVKADRQSLKDQFRNYQQQVQQEYGPVIQGVQKLNYALQQGNYDAAFAVLGLDKRNVLTWALQYAQMNEQQRTERDRLAGTELQTFDMQTQQQQYQQQVQGMLAEARGRELDFTLQRPDISQAQQAFDQKYGEGAFRAEVIKRGQYYGYQGKDIPVEQAVKEVMQYVGWQAQQTPTPQPQVAAPAMPQAGPSAAPQAQQAKPVIPNIQGRGTSPAKRVIGSMADIRARRKELEAQGE